MLADSADCTPERGVDPTGLAFAEPCPAGGRFFVEIDSVVTGMEVLTAAVG